MKNSVGDLAVFGAPPAFAEPLHVGRPNVGDRAVLLERFNDILDRRFFTNGGFYEGEFERRLAGTTAVRHAIATCNATVGLEIAIRAAGLQGEVIVPSFTFIATAHALQWQQITPVFCDIDPDSYTIDPERVEELITPRTTGIIGVNLWGRTCNAEALADIAARHGLRLLFDSAHALGCTRRGRPLGGFGDAEVFSFHATKFVNSFEGGAITTNDERFAQRVRLMKNFGFVDYDVVEHIGTNGKMTEIAAAMGLTSLESLDEFRAVNRRNHELYAGALAQLPGLRLLSYDDADSPNYQYAVIDVEAAEAGLARDHLYGILQAENVLARRYFHPGCHRMEPYRTLYPDAGPRLPVTERAAARVLSLPTGTAVGPQEIAGICAIIACALANADAVRARWPLTGDTGEHRTSPPVPGPNHP